MTDKTLQEAATCSHFGPCGPAHFTRDCIRLQRAQAIKYSVNDTWHIAELEPELFALYSPIRRQVVAIGSLEEIITAYRAREPFIPITRTPPTKPRRFENVKVNI